MNYLAHAWLWPDDEQTLAGSLFGDFIHGPIAPDLPVKLAAAIALHRRIDRATDQHPQVIALREQMPPRFRRYAGIILDMAFDHVLARDFARWSNEPLADFAQRVYDALLRYRDLVPVQRQHRIRYLVQHRLLETYRHQDGVIAALQGLSGRLSKANPLGESGPVLLALLPQINDALPPLLTHLQQVASAYRAAHCTG